MVRHMATALCVLPGGGWVILVVEETDNLTCMKKSTISGKRYMLDYEHGARLL